MRGTEARDRRHTHLPVHIQHDRHSRVAEPTAETQATAHQGPQTQCFEQTLLEALLVLTGCFRLRDVPPPLTRHLSDSTFGCDRSQAWLTGSFET